MSSPFPNNNLYQKAIYWGAPIANGYGGYSWDDPVELDCRWSSSSQVVTDANGEEYTASISVQLDQDVERNGMMLLGELDDLDSDQYNDPVAAGAMFIVRFDKIPSVKADRYFRIAYLNSVYRRIYL